MKNLTIFTLLILVLFSCKKSDRDEDTTTNTSTDYGTAQSMAYDVFKMVHQAALSTKGITNNNLSNSSTIFGCDTLIVDTLINKSIGIQFNGNCNSRTGRINATFSNKYDVIGSVINVSFNNYMYGVYPITGTISYTYNGVVNGIPTYTFTTDKFTIHNNARFIEFTANQTIEIHGGETTAAFSDDIYMIDGGASGRVYAGNQFLATINTDLTLLGNCDYVSSGIVLVNPENKNTRIMNFGFGCDNTADVQIYDIHYSITFP